MRNLLRAFRPIVGDFLSTIVFIIAVEVFKNVPLAIVFGIAAGIGQFAVLLWRRQHIALMQWMSLVLVLVLGGASLILADPRFVMIKPSIAMFAIGAVMLRRGWMLRYLPPAAVDDVPPNVIIVFGYVWAVLLCVMAAINLALALLAPLATWVFYNAVVPLSCQLGLFLIQYLVMRQLVLSKRSAANPS